ncbi:MAG: MoaD/ThiS family protein [Acidobacteriota bacterium]
MPVKVLIPTPLRKLTNGEGAVAIDGGSIREVIQNLDGKHAGLRERLCQENGEVRRFINIFVNDEDIRFLQSLDTPVKDGDQVSIVPAIAGGGRSL